LLILEGNKRFHYTISGVGCNKRFIRILQCVKRFFRLFGENLMNSPTFHRVFTKFSPGFGIHRSVLQIHQVFTRFPPRFQNNQQFTKILEIHQVFTRFSNFSPTLGDQSGGFRIASSFHCSDGRHVILKETFLRHHFQEKNARSVLYSLLNTQNASLE